MRDMAHDRRMCEQLSQPLPLHACPNLVKSLASHALPYWLDQVERLEWEAVTLRQEIANTKQYAADLKADRERILNALDHAGKLLFDSDDIPEAIREMAAERDALRKLLRRCHAELVEHNGERKHLTSEAFLDEVARAAGPEEVGKEFST